VQIHLGKGTDFEASCTDTRTLISLLLRRQWERRGLLLAEAAKRLGESRNASVLATSVERLCLLCRSSLSCSVPSLLRQT